MGSFGLCLYFLFFFLGNRHRVDFFGPAREDFESEITFLEKVIQSLPEQVDQKNSLADSEDSQVM